MQDNYTKDNPSLTHTPSPKRPTLKPVTQSNGSPHQPRLSQPNSSSSRKSSTAARSSPSSRQAASPRLNSTPKSQMRPREAMDQSPIQGSTKASVARPNLSQQAFAGKESELKVVAYNLPPEWDTRKTYDRFKQYGTLVKIEIQAEGQKEPRRKTWLVLSPPRCTREWITNGIIVENRRVRFKEWSPEKPARYTSPKEHQPDFAEETATFASQLDLGVMVSTERMLVLRELRPATPNAVEVEVNLRYKVVDIKFSLHMSDFSVSKEQANRRHFKTRLNFPQLRGILEMQKHSTGEKAWVISTDLPPLVYRKADLIEATHEPEATYWTEWQTWYRQTDINTGPVAARNAPTQLHKDASTIGIGRSLTYCLVFSKETVHSAAFGELRRILQDHDIPIQDKPIKFESAPMEFSWSWLDNSSEVVNTEGVSSSSQLHQMAEEVIHLPFTVRYQLEACISHNLLHESNIDKAFLRRLAEMEPCRATKLLEKVVDEKERFFNPEDVFNRLLHRVNVVCKPVPTYCAVIRAATVTPTTIYFMSPITETSNRVIRKFQHYEDRFLRVKFTDERYKGKVWSAQDASMNEIYTRIKRTMSNGIRVGDRHYEFLAFGNSQFRDHGAWFFASTSDLTAQQIRDKMGEFSSIKVVAKYCSRLGQCFSTSRATRWSIEDEKIPDIERDGFCFTDGVGKISPCLAQLISQELGCPATTNDYPSAFQFRREGSKGILVVDPSLSKLTTQTRPSQEKFSGLSHHGLEVLRVSHFSTAYLNVQLILVLSALGVEDNVFLGKMKLALRELEDAMVSETKALELLQKNVDYNHMTIQLAAMVLDGFKETNDPFTISCFHVWRAWSLKYLKEKARIFVEKGAFVLGCVDETATLKGHSNKAESSTVDHSDVGSLPEIFLQIDVTGKGGWRVVEGACTLARNPSLHPGDIRVVHAVDVPALRHIKNCVVFPQTGDRDLANMCSGGDLDGDDYLVMWDEDLMPKEWNHPPMDYTAPSPVLSRGDVTVDDMTSFFVTHMKHDNLGQIAVAHRYWADRLADGVKSPECLELARLHSMAVDYAKTGVPAEMPRRLRVKQRPHWSNPKNKAWYRSNSVIGKLYDLVQQAQFVPAWGLPFDQRILEAYQLDDQTLEDAREIKELYDTAMRHTMAKFSIENEFEVWTTFVLKHSDDIGDYKFAETIGEAASVLKDSYQKLCYVKAGTNDKEREWSKMGPFIAAMYTVTANEITTAMEDRNKVQLKGGQYQTVDPPTFENMPFMSFPWLFPAELGRIANKRERRGLNTLNTLAWPVTKPAKNTLEHLFDNNEVIEELEEVTIPTGCGKSFEDPQRHDTPLSLALTPEPVNLTDSMALYDLAELECPCPYQKIEHEGGDSHNVEDEVEEATQLQAGHRRWPEPTEGSETAHDLMQMHDSDEEVDEEVENITIDAKSSALDAFQAFMGI